MCVNVMLTMGLHSATYLHVCQRVTNVIAYIAKKKVISVSNYLNDFFIFFWVWVVVVVVVGGGGG